MRDKQATFALFFPEPMADEDRANFEASGVKRVHLFLGVARNNPNNQLEYLHGKGGKVTLRVEEPVPGQSANSYYNEATHPRIVSDISWIDDRVEVEAVIVGNEPQGFHSQERGSANWGNNPDGEFPKGRAWAHQYALDRLRAALQAHDYKVISPGYKRGRVRPQQAAQPGNATWGRICSDAYDRCTAGGIHVYADAMQSGVDDERYLWAIGEELERVHTAAWLNETNINSPSASAQERMRGCMHMYDLLAAQPWAVDVIGSFCPFVSNGRAGEEWSHMIMRDPVAYKLLGSWMSSL